MHPRIDNYVFGRMTIGGRQFASDLIIYEDGKIEDNWRRFHGHKLLPEDIGTLLESRPDRLIIGTGASGRMAVDQSVITQCRQFGIDMAALPSGDAAKQFNADVEKGARVAACFHLTC